MGTLKYCLLLAFVLLLGTIQVAAVYTNGTVVAPCDSPIYCYGDILKEIELAQPFVDSKTFVDLPTIRPLTEVVAAFAKLQKPIQNNTELNDFLTTYFGKAGSELAPVPAGQLQTAPDFLDNVNSTVVAEFVEKVIGIWPDLTRNYVGAANCTGCVDSFLPVQRTFVVAGGRFREPYYWDSFWIVEGLLRTKGSFTEIARNIIENFLDFVEQFGFVPNGARVYYLNRSQPPLLTQMVKVYVEYTGDTELLNRAIPLLEKEQEFWRQNQSVLLHTVGGPVRLNHYSVPNSQPRPESYREDWITANNESYYAGTGIIYPVTHHLNDTEKGTLYANLASGAESGWDYSSRWLANPNDAAKDIYFPLRTLNTVEIVPVDLNSILYDNEMTISSFHNQTGNYTAAEAWASRAATRNQAMYELMWNETQWAYFDYNMTSSAQNVFILADSNAKPTDLAGAPEGYQVALSPAQFYPFWTGAAPALLKLNPLAVKMAYRRVAELLTEKAGGIGATNLLTGQQWDEPNVWAPLQYILIKGLLNTPPTFGKEDPAWQWTQDTALALSQRYVDSAFCTWRATGGSTSNLTKIASAPSDSDGVMFEKYDDSRTDRVGGGGEYEVVKGFGWSNGVLIWIADIFGSNLTEPVCNDLNVTASTGAKMRRDARWLEESAVHLHKRDLSWIKDYTR